VDDRRPDHREALAELPDAPGLRAQLAFVMRRLDDRAPPPAR
jgi:hypothetical protein